MKLTCSRYDLKLRHTFTIARGARDVSPVVIVELEHDGITGFGESAPIARYGESIDSVTSFVSRIDWTRFNDPFQIESILTSVNGIAEGNTAAKASIDIALHDWVGRKLGLPLHKYWGLDKSRTPLTSYTIGIDSPAVIEQKVREAEAYPILKVKLGGDNDEEIIRAVRNVTKKALRVDANEGWKVREQAVEKIKWLEQEGVEFVEQPMPAADLAGTAWTRERVNLPLIADENSLRLHDVPRLQGAFDGINIKLMKCTGLREALRMIHTARACGMKVMIGCMIESSVAISAAAQLSPLIDYADLDGNVLITNDPFDGVRSLDGVITLLDRPGIGIERRS
ncbi:MAG: dipeptide epimerase [Ignavibacteriales bacterium]|nr:dipeptide epimerase [Ignavibacteriales bacterium]